MNPQPDSTWSRFTRSSELQGISKLQTPSTSSDAHFPLRWDEATKHSFNSRETPSPSMIDEHLRHVISRIPKASLTEELLRLAERHRVPVPAYTRSVSIHESVVASITRMVPRPLRWSKRAKAACDNCRKTKQGCRVSDKSGRCDRCKEKGSDCIFPEREKRGAASAKTQTKSPARTEGSPQMSFELDAHPAGGGDKFPTQPTVLNTSDESQAQTLAMCAEGNVYFQAPYWLAPVGPGLPYNQSTWGRQDPNQMIEHAPSEVPLMYGLQEPEDSASIDYMFHLSSPGCQ